MERSGITPKLLSRLTARVGEYHADDALDKGKGVNTPPLSEAYISMLLSGKRTASRSPHTRERIAAALDVPVDWIEVERPDPDERNPR